MKTKKIETYIIADTLYLVTVFLLLDHYKSIGITSASMKFNVLISVIVIGIYGIRYFFRPSYEHVVSLSEKGWKITGYYSRKALTRKEIYLDSYSFWVYSGLVVSVIYCLLMVLVILSYPNQLQQENFLIIFILQIVLLGILPWYITYKREQQKWR